MSSGFKIGAAAFVGACLIGAVTLKAKQLTPSCDEASVAETVKDLATKYIRSNIDYVFEFVKFPTEESLKTPGIFGPQPTYELSAFRDRGKFGPSGQRCAVAAKVTLKANIRLDLIGEYTIETTTDGKTVVTARFSPN